MKIYGKQRKFLGIKQFKCIAKNKSRWEEGK